MFVDKKFEKSYSKGLTALEGILNKWRYVTKRCVECGRLKKNSNINNHISTLISQLKHKVKKIWKRHHKKI